MGGFTVRLGLLFILILAFAAKFCAGETAEEMLSACRPITQAKISNGTVDLPSDFESGTCWGAFGMLQSVLFLQEPNGERTLHSCPSSDVTRTELTAIFVKYVTEHPEDYSKGFQLVALNSILKVYPCGKGSR
jgi:hypothetical protein